MEKVFVLILKRFDMKLFIKIFLGLFATCQAYSNEKTSCSILFESENPRAAALNFSKSLPQKVDWKQWQARRIQTRVTDPDKKGHFWVANESRFETQLRFGRNVTSAHYLSQELTDSILNQKNSENSAENLLLNKARGLINFRKAKNRALDFVIAAYRERRPHWTLEFIKKLRKLADEYEAESTYIEIAAQDWENLLRPKDKNGEYVRNGNLDPDLVGAIRLIREKNGSLPLEEYLGVKLKVLPNTIKVEPGNFAMANEANEISTIEISIQMIAQMDRYKIEFRKNPFFVTYADRLSEKLYGSMGFKYLTRDMLEPVSPEASQQMEVDDQGRVRILKNGVRWAPMYATEEMMTDILKTKLERIAIRNEPDDVANSRALNSYFLKAIEQSRSAVTDSPEVFIGSSVHKQSGQPVQISLQISHPTQDTAEIYLQLEDEHHQRFRETIRVPYPIPEGFGTNPEFDWKAGRVTYLNGVLTLRSFGRGSLLSNKNFGLQEVVIDSKLLQPRSAKIISKFEGVIEEFLEIEF